MADQHKDADACVPRVKAAMRLGVESFILQAEEGILSQQLCVMKEESMIILKNFITKNNISNDVPDEAVESNSECDKAEPVDKPAKKSKKLV